MLSQSIVLPYFKDLFNFPQSHIWLVGLNEMAVMKLDQKMS